MTITEAFRILKLSKTKDLDALKKAYRTQAKKHHPDKGGNEETFKQISIAYEVAIEYAESTSSYTHEEYYYNGQVFRGHDLNDLFQRVDEIYRQRQRSQQRSFFEVKKVIWNKSDEEYQIQVKLRNISMIRIRMGYKYQNYRTTSEYGEFFISLDTKDLVNNKMRVTVEAMDYHGFPVFQKTYRLSKKPLGFLTKMGF